LTYILSNKNQSSNTYLKKYGLGSFVGMPKKLISTPINGQEIFVFPKIYNIIGGSNLILNVFLSNPSPVQNWEQG
jgi:hypothetical protein